MNAVSAFALVGFFGWVFARSNRPHQLHPPI